MFATGRLPQISLIVSAVSVSVAMVCKDAVRERIERILGVNAPGGIWRLLAIFLTLINLKNIPFAWHFRLFHSLIYHLFVQPTDIKPQHLFKPVIHTTHTPMAETDYNFHKSNSTYFTDLDISRTHLATAILRKGIRGVKNERGGTFSFGNTPGEAIFGKNTNDSPLGPGEQRSSVVGAKCQTEQEWYQQATQPGSLLIALGAVTCHFHREIPPYKQYEVWTRLLTWDRKWLYIVSHFVESGTFKPSGYSLQPGRSGNRRVEHLTDEDKAKLKRRIFASSLAKYVVKKGRLTIPPELVLERSQMLPTRPEGVSILGGWTPATSKDITPERTATPSPKPESPIITAEVHDHGSIDLENTTFEKSLFPSLDQVNSGDENWTWELVQNERLKGLKLAEAFDSLDNIRDIFDLKGSDALGRYTDFAFSV